MKNLISILAVSILAPLTTQAQWSQPVNLLNTDLMKLQKKEVYLKTEDQVRAMNQDAITKLEATRPSDKNTSKRREFLTREEMIAIHQEIYQNEVASSGDAYSQPNVSIGYCFGRATFYHITLLKNKVDKSAIRKAFVVGPMDAYGLMWQFHVSTIVRGEDMKWYTIDSNYSKPMELSKWTEAHFQMGPQKSVRLYITDPIKFTPTASYDRLQMGLSLDRETDWYRGYFQDLMKSFKQQKQILD